MLVRARERLTETISKMRPGTVFSASEIAKQLDLSPIAVGKVLQTMEHLIEKEKRPGKLRLGYTYRRL